MHRPIGRCSKNGFYFLVLKFGSKWPNMAQFLTENNALFTLLK